jgi:hypothetical protein
MKRWYYIAKSMKLPKQATAHMLHTAKEEEKKCNNWFTPIITLFQIHNNVLCDGQYSTKFPSDIQTEEFE